MRSRLAPAMIVVGVLLGLPGAYLASYLTFFRLEDTGFDVLHRYVHAPWQKGFYAPAAMVESKIRGEPVDLWYREDS